MLFILYVLVLLYNYKRVIAFLVKQFHDPFKVNSYNCTAILIDNSEAKKMKNVPKWPDKFSVRNSNRIAN